MKKMNEILLIDWRERERARERERKREREREKFTIEDVNCVKDLKKKNTRIIHNILK